MTNQVLRKAKKNKVDEFYTQLVDIEKELKFYKEYFEDKVVFCNCDDPFESNFFKYFAINFNHLKLKKLIATSYSGSTILGKQLNVSVIEGEGLADLDSKLAYKIIISEVTDENMDGAVDLSDVELLLRNNKNIMTPLLGDGDFRSEESISLLLESDIVVTNPPFSLFREYVSQLVEYNKDFILIGNTNSLTYKEIFKLIKEDRLRTGYSNFNTGMYFYVPSTWSDFHKVIDDKKMVRVSSSCWFTSLPVEKHKVDLALYKKFDPKVHLRYENYNALNVDKVSDIPYDCTDELGVPVTFLDKYNPRQFKLVGLGIASSGLEIGVRPYTIEHKKYRKEIQKRAAVDGDLYLVIEGEVVVPYARIIIQKMGKDNEN